jgi:adenylate cyclase
MPVMPHEIERKFLVRDDSWREGAAGRRMRQGYLSLEPARTVRVRISDEQAWLNIKGRTEGVRRLEFEYPIPVDDARALLALCGDAVVDKTRYRVRHGAHTWEVDEFHGANAGLLVAEIELAHEDERFAQPPWLGREVSGEARYYNSSLAQRPFNSWPGD